MDKIFCIVVYKSSLLRQTDHIGRLAQIVWQEPVLTLDVEVVKQIAFISILHFSASEMEL